MTEEGLEDGVTFVIPTFNRASLIGECLQSIQDQTERRWSVIVVDDASTDGTAEIVDRLKVPNLLYVKNETQRGASNSRNYAARRAITGLIVFIDSDDRLHPEYLAVVRRVFREDADVGIVCCDSRIIDAAGAVLHDGASFQALEARRKAYLLRAGRRGFADIYSFSTTFPGTAIRSTVFDRLGGFDQDIFPMDDVDLQLRAAVAGVGVHYLDQVLADYRTHVGSASAGAGRAINTSRKKVECLARWMVARPPSAPIAVLRRRLADAHLELAIALWQSGRIVASSRGLFAAARTDFRVIPAFLRWKVGE